MAAMANLVSADPSLRVLGFALDEWWAGPEEFLTIRETEISEIPALHIQIERVDAFEDGGFDGRRSRRPWSRLRRRLR